MTKYRKLKYRKGDREEMLKYGFPLCIPNRKTGGEHCNSCIKSFRKIFDHKNDNL